MLVSYTLPGAAAGVTLAEPVLCTTADELSFRVSRALGQPVAEVAGPEFAVSIHEVRAGFQAQLETGASSHGTAGNTTGQRRFSASNCEELTDSVALAIALALGSGAPVEQAPEIEQATASAAASPPSAPRPGDDAPPGELPVSAAASASGPHLGLRAWVLADTGSLPGAGFGVSAGAELAWSAFELRALGLFLPPREGHVAGGDASTSGADLSLLAGSLLACVPLSDAGRRLQLLACVGWELGQLSGTGTGVATPHERNTLWSAGRLDLGADWLVPDTALRLGLLVSVLAPISRDEFILKDIGAVHQPANVVARAGLALGWSWQ